MHYDNFRDSSRLQLLKFWNRRHFWVQNEIPKSETNVPNSQWDHTEQNKFMFIWLKRMYFFTREKVFVCCCSYEVYSKCFANIKLFQPRGVFCKWQRLKQFRFCQKSNKSNQLQYQYQNLHILFEWLCQIEKNQSTVVICEHVTTD
jgi:hypothetical protein